MCGHNNMIKWAIFPSAGGGGGGVQNQNKGMVEILNRYSHCPYLLSGETTAKPHSKWRGSFNISKILKKFKQHFKEIQ